MSSNTGPQYSRGGQNTPSASNQYPSGSPLSPSSDPAGYPQTGYPQTGAQPNYSGQAYQDPQYGQQPYQDQPYQEQPYGQQPSQGYGDTRGYDDRRGNTGPVSSRQGESYGYDYRYADGDLGDDRPGANAMAWFALVLTLIALALTWDKFGAFIALPVFFFSFLFASVALTRRGQRKWHAWIALWLTVLGSLAALVSVTISLVGLMGGLSYAGGTSVMGVVDLPPMQIERISDVSVSFPGSGLDSLTFDEVRGTSTPNTSTSSTPVPSSAVTSTPAPTN